MSAAWQAGQSVAIFQRIAGALTINKSVISSVTKTGRANVGSLVFLPNGKNYGGWGSFRIEPWTADHERRLKEQADAEVATKRKADRAAAARKRRIAADIDALQWAIRFIADSSDKRSDRAAKIMKFWIDKLGEDA